jgi:uroporphyrinogen III methyltransferase/synthase
MKNLKTVLLTGIRGSKLSAVQASNAVVHLEQTFPNLSFNLKEMLSPGDRDQRLDLRNADNDFFTQDLDNAVIQGKIDCAIHSAKDLPYDLYASKLKHELDWFWLPWSEDPLDVLVFNLKFLENLKKTSPESALSILQGSDMPLVVGVSSERREKFCRKIFPNGIMKPIRGVVENRIQQLDDGDFDVLIMAAAGLKRINLAQRINYYIPSDKLSPPAGQGVLAITFKKGNELFNSIRKMFVKQIVFAGAGCGNADFACLATINELKNCEVCLYDALAPEKLLQNLSVNAERVFVGKRAGLHSKKQAEITQLIIDYARQGKKIVRLKGGDPGFFGRLAEEIDALDQLKLPFRVIPAVSSLQVATTSTGLLLTRRGLSRGFSVATPRKADSSGFSAFSNNELKTMPTVFFMGTSVLEDIIKDMLQRGFSETECVSVVFAAGTDFEKIISGTILNIIEKTKDIIKKTQMPGIIIVGPIADSKFLYTRHGALAGKKVLITVSEALQEKTATYIHNFDGIAIPFPLIKLKAIDDFKPINADYYIFTSPSSVKIFMNKYLEFNYDIRKLPKIIVCGKGTSDAFKIYGIIPDIEPIENFGADGLLQILSNSLPMNCNIVRWCSDKSSPQISEYLKNSGYNIQDIILYQNTIIKYKNNPEFDIVLFASASAVMAFLENFGADALSEKIVATIGKPTAEILKTINLKSDIIIPHQATLNSLTEAIALYCINKIVDDL